MGAVVAHGRLHAKITVLFTGFSTNAHLAVGKLGENSVYIIWKIIGWGEGIFQPGKTGDVLCISV
jgi:hypothetical protein